MQRKREEIYIKDTLFRIIVSLWSMLHPYQHQFLALCADIGVNCEKRFIELTAGPKSYVETFELKFSH